MIGPSTAPSDEPLALALDGRWLDAGRARRAGFQLALAGAVASHLVLGAALTGGLDGIWTALGGGETRSQRPIGDPAGQIEGVAAEVIDSAEFDKRFISFKAGNAAADAEAAPQQPMQPAEPPSTAVAKPEPEAVAELKPADGWAPSAATPEPRQPEKQSPETPAPRAKEKPAEPRKPEPQEALTDAEMRELLSQTMEDLQSSVVAVSAPGAAKLGEASPFVRSVIRTLKSNMPKPVGMKGNVVIQLVVGVTGEIEAIRVVRSSGRPELDRLVAERVLKTRLAAPPPTASLRERVFQITYAYN